MTGLRTTQSPAPRFKFLIPHQHSRGRSQQGLQASRHVDTARLSQLSLPAGPVILWQAAVQPPICLSHSQGAWHEAGWVLTPGTGSCLYKLPGLLSSLPYQFHAAAVINMVAQHDTVLPFSFHRSEAQQASCKPGAFLGLWECLSLKVTYILWLMTPSCKVFSCLHHHIPTSAVCLSPPPLRTHASSFCSAEQLWPLSPPRPLPSPRLQGYFAMEGRPSIS